jgi:hypothetical protein
LHCPGLPDAALRFRETGEAGRLNPPSQSGLHGLRGASRHFVVDCSGAGSRSAKRLARLKVEVSRGNDSLDVVSRIDAEKRRNSRLRRRRSAACAPCTARVVDKTIAMKASRLIEPSGWLE